MFRNEPLIDFTIPDMRSRYANALRALGKQIQEKSILAMPIIDGKQLETGELHPTIDPSNSSLTIGNTHFASEREVSLALDCLRQGKRNWEVTPLEERANIIKNAARIMRERRMELAALIIREVGKPWKDSDADVVEAIDFCEYYAYEALQLKGKRTQELPGEDNFYSYIPRGLGLAIAPWNFPLAISCGMTVAGLVTGNVMILKPAEQSNLITFEFSKILLEAGVPTDAFAFLPGYGEKIGRMLVSHPETDLICFTGSKSVGLEILRTASEVKEGQKNIKKVILELGGKNAIIVDEDADLDEAIKGVLSSAFGYAGQKCSACSRAIIVGKMYEPFLERLKEAAQDIIIGPAADPGTVLGPVIDSDALRRILGAIEKAERDCTMLLKGNPPTGGYFIPPVVFKDVSPTSTLWKEEIFGPVLACTRATSFSEAIRLANDSIYALTGGIYSRNPLNIETGKKEFKVGNLYINRGCTGAIVCRQPFGGFKMSGIGSKAGGPDYLLQFVEPRTITENTMRRGFAPS